MTSSDHTNPADTEFGLEVFQNEYLATGAGMVHAVVSVSCSSGWGSTLATADAEAAEVIVIDASGSMGSQRKMAHARKAAAAAVACLRDGTRFAVLAGTQGARPVYPTVGLAVASAATRKEAADRLRRVRAFGGTAIGTWLLTARDLLTECGGANRHVILLTDGQNDGESPEAFLAAIEATRGMFQCDCRGVGADWRVDEMRAVASQLLGTVDVIPDPSMMEADFLSMMQQSMGRRAGSVALRVWTPTGARLSFLRQVHPNLEDLAANVTRVDDHLVDHPTGAWGAERRDYHLCVEVPPQAPGREMLAARVQMVTTTAEGSVSSRPALIRAVWTDDEALSTRINREVAHYTGQTELALAIQSGLASRRAGDVESAVSSLGRAVSLAAASGNDDALARLSAVVEILDARDGSVRLRERVDAVAEVVADARSTRTRAR